MLKYLNSPLKVAGSLLMLAGAAIAVFTFNQFFFLGLSIVSLGLLLQVTAGLFFKSRKGTHSGRWHEMLLLLFIIGFFVVLLLDYFGIIKIVL